ARIRPGHRDRRGRRADDGRPRGGGSRDQGNRRGGCALLVARPPRVVRGGGARRDLVPAGRDDDRAADAGRDRQAERANDVDVLDRERDRSGPVRGGPPSADENARRGDAGGGGDGGGRKRGRRIGIRLGL